MTVESKPVVDDTGLGLAPLAVINFKRLLEKDENEILKLYKASVSPGFFYIDVRDSEQHMADIKQMNAICKRYFSEPEEVRMRDFVEGAEFHGYNTEEGWISFGILHDDLANDRALLPEVLASDAATIKRFGSYSHHIVNTMITHLSKLLWPRSSISLEDRHRSTGTSNSSLNLYKGPALEKAEDFGDSTHTDGGTLTILYCDKWATQIELPWNKQWAWVEPRPGHMVVNVADSLQSMSGGRLHSCRHRVSLPKGGYEEVLYFFRPDHEASLAAL